MSVNPLILDEFIRCEWSSFQLCFSACQMRRLSFVTGTEGDLITLMCERAGQKHKNVMSSKRATF